MLKNLIVVVEPKKSFFFLNWMAFMVHKSHYFKASILEQDDLLSWRFKVLCNKKIIVKTNLIKGRINFRFQTKKSWSRSKDWRRAIVRS
jgi:hypothetical protein